MISSGECLHIFVIFLFFPSPQIKASLFCFAAVNTFLISRSVNKKAFLHSVLPLSPPALGSIEHNTVFSLWSECAGVDLSLLLQDILLLSFI